MDFLEVSHLVYKHYFYFRKGLPIPVDLYGQMLRAGVSPETVERRFEEGFNPEDLIFVFIEG